MRDPAAHSRHRARRSDRSGRGDARARHDGRQGSRLNAEAARPALCACGAVMVIGVALGYGTRQLTLREVRNHLVRTGGSWADILMIAAAADIIMGTLQPTGLGFALTMLRVKLGMPPRADALRDAARGDCRLFHGARASPHAFGAALHARRRRREHRGRRRSTTMRRGDFAIVPFRAGRITATKAPGLAPGSMGRTCRRCRSSKPARYARPPGRRWRWPKATWPRRSATSALTLPKAMWPPPPAGPGAATARKRTASCSCSPTGWHRKNRGPPRTARRLSQGKTRCVSAVSTTTEGVVKGDMVHDVAVVPDELPALRWPPRCPGARWKRCAICRRWPTPARSSRRR
ncbi:MAG: TRAP transporter large permease subunit [Gemmobacter sp.]|uniref:TRAP transporter large permease subunit n=1 Tax=Gemmobacter sp. TaxID=1898957 RepID=UPI00391DF6B1